MSWNTDPYLNNSAGFSSPGDPYPDNKNDTKRGVCLAGLGSEGGFDPAAPYGFSGNPYPDDTNKTKSFYFEEPDAMFDVGHGSGGTTRGVKLSGFVGAEPGEGFGSLMGCGGGDVMSKQDVQASVPFCEKPPFEKVSHTPPFFFEHYNEIFADGDKPPPAPTGKYSGLAATVHEVKTGTPWSLGNSLLRFLSESLPSQSVFVELLKPIPSKEGKTKYNLKLLAFVHSNWCQMKVRIYLKADEESNDVYLIEFQRRSGDSLAFNCVYREAEKYLQDQLFIMDGRGNKGGRRGMSLFVPPIVPLPPMQDGDLPWAEPECMFGPVFDLSKSKCVRYQAEGATAIAEMAKAAEGKPEQQFPWSEALEEMLYELLEVQEAIVAFPTVRALHSLAKLHPQARLVAAKKEKVLERSSSSLVRGEARRLRELIACA